MKKNPGGFTLIELMIIVAIIGILAIVVIPKFIELIRKADEAATKGKLSSIRSALHIYYAENDGVYPQGTNNYVPNITYLQAALTPKYLDNWPVCYVPKQHRKANTVDNYPSFSDSWDPSCDGEWGYIGNETDDSWGTIFVECWHTDTKGNYISGW